MQLAIQALSLASLGHATDTKGTNISNKRNIVKNPNWLEADKKGGGLEPRTSGF